MEKAVSVHETFCVCVRACVSVWVKRVFEKWREIGSVHISSLISNSNELSQARLPVRKSEDPSIRTIVWSEQMIFPRSLRRR